MKMKKLGLLFMMLCMVFAVNCTLQIYTPHFYVI
mgnify:CR=1 FL=1